MLQLLKNAHNSSTQDHLTLPTDITSRVAVPVRDQTKATRIVMSKHAFVFTKQRHIDGTLIHNLKFTTNTSIMATSTLQVHKASS